LPPSGKVNNRVALIGNEFAGINIENHDAIDIYLRSSIEGTPGEERSGVCRVNQFWPKILNDFTLQQFGRIDCQEMWFIAVASRIFEPELFGSPFSPGNFIPARGVSVNGVIAVVDFCRIDCAAATNKEREQNQQRSSEEAGPPTSEIRIRGLVLFRELWNRPHALIDALAIENQTGDIEEY
jgi:hypothetical protein